MLAHWMMTGPVMVALIFYFGPFSSGLVVQPMTVLFIALGRDRTTARFLLGGSLLFHLVVAVPVMLGWTKDVGLFSAGTHGRSYLLLEVVVLGCIVAGYALGRWARHMSATALAELAEAKRLIGDQKQILVEAQDRAAQIDRAKKGRWTGQTIGRWQLGDVLGRGAMGEVYEAQDAAGQAAAVKVLTAAAEESPSLVQRFNRELRIATQLDSPHIVKVLDVSSATARVPFLAMERLHGVDLAARLRFEVRMPFNEVVTMLRQVALGLDAAHKAGVVHRDLKPHNLFLHDSKRWKILDFGVAKMLGVDGTLTRDSMIGTPQYMAPEQAQGEAVSSLSDIYALGAIAYRCITGRVPYGATDFSALVFQIVSGAPARPSTMVRVPPGVDDVMAIAMAKDPQQRFASAIEFADQLAAAATGAALKSLPPANAWAEASDG
jgi:serine/threonine-protein kinase